MDQQGRLYRVAVLYWKSAGMAPRVLVRDLSIPVFNALFEKRDVFSRGFYPTQDPLALLLHLALLM